jgi:hypothetical protein
MQFLNQQKKMRPLPDQIRWLLKQGLEIRDNTVKKKHHIKENK